ncbi:hypothetical protein [Nostoc sp. C117]|uniref:hypothetical protein n=1 Tax=Nostoc sp. C117 TaxID=3349875 RepID=UPI00370D627F
MPRTLVVSGQAMSQWNGVQVWQGHNGHFQNITANWSWSADLHQHYEVFALADGSYWVPVSTHPPGVWGGSTQVLGTFPQGNQPVNPNGTEFRPDTTYIWIPNASIPGNLVPGITTNWVVCGYPDQYPPLAMDDIHLSLLDEILTSDKSDQKAFKDSDGLIAFVNLSSSFITSNPEFTTGQDVCDKVASFFATVRIKVFGFLKNNPGKVLPGDQPPKTQWDSSVTHYIMNMLTGAGGFADFQITSESYSVTQVITEFNTAIIKIMFDAVTLPEAILGDVLSFVQGVGSSLRASWDDKSRHYQTCLLGQCHEAVPEDDTGTNFRYFPKVKYYYISVDSSQTAFTSDCAKVEKITFNFKYDYYVTALKKSILDNQSDDYQKFYDYLKRAQDISYKDASNKLDAILKDTASNAVPSKAGANSFGVDLTLYPLAAEQPPKTIERVLNSRIIA